MGGTVELEAELACRCGRGRAAGPARGDVVVGPAWFVPPDEQDRIPDVGTAPLRTGPNSPNRSLPRSVLWRRAPPTSEVAERLYLSPYRVNSHLRHVLAKLGVRSRVELARLAAARGTSTERS